MNPTLIPDYVKLMLPPKLDFEPPRRNVLPDEEEMGGLEDDWGYEELNFDDEV